ncbi:hypothetical protein [Flavobacterium sp.]|uniref:hypothetical protein n=1 Tax=Flavobacterium sp. TaxID=239 RepID=UPI0037BFFD33
MIPQPGQGKPVTILNGQKDCSLSKFPKLFCCIKKGTISVTSTPIIPNILFFTNDLIV